MDDSQIIVGLGRVAVEEAHRASCSAADMAEYMSRNYTETAIRDELNDTANIYHIIFCEGQPAGFSKIVLNAPYANIPGEHVTKLDRIYLLNEFFGMQLGYRLLNHNIELSKASGQSGMWLFTWVGNTRAIAFYKKTGFEVIGEHWFKVSDTHSNANHHMMLRYAR